MSDMPKRIFADYREGSHDIGDWGSHRLVMDQNDTEYIRADLVDELIEAVKNREELSPTEFGARCARAIAAIQEESP